MKTKNLMKFFSVVTLLLIMQNLTFAQKVANPVADFKYQLSKDGNGVLIVEYNGASSNIIIPSEIEEMPVVEISNGFIFNRELVKTIEFPDTVTTIVEDDPNKGILSDCVNLISVKLPNNPRFNKIPRSSFAGCEKLKNIDIPNSIIIIGPFAFSSSGVESLKIPDSVEKIEQCAFSGTQIKSIIIPNSVKELGTKNNGGFYKKEGGIFSYCKLLESVVISSNVTEIPRECFIGCEKLKEIRLPANLKEISVYAFSGCESLEEITLPKSLEKFSDAFIDCGIKSLVIPDSVISFNCRFSGCNDLESIRFSNSLEELSTEAESYVLEFDDGKEKYFPIGTFRGITVTELPKLKSINIPASTKRLTNRVFSNLPSLTEIIIPDSIEYIYFSSDVFEGTPNLSLKTQKRLRDLGYTGDF